MLIEVGDRYVTKCGNVVKCLHKLPDDTYLCQYIKTIEGHDSLKGEIRRWREDGKWVKFSGNSEDGKWVKFSGSVHDIVKAV